MRGNQERSKDEPSVGSPLCVEIAAARRPASPGIPSGDNRRGHALETREPANGFVPARRARAMVLL